MNFKILAIRDWLKLFNRQGVFMMLMPTVSEQQGRNPHAKHQLFAAMEGRDVAMDTRNMAMLGGFASKQASSLNTFVSDSPQVYFQQGRALPRGRAEVHPII